MENNFSTKDWDYYSCLYDTLNELRPYQQMQVDILEKLDLSLEQKILDCACGTGNLAFWAQKLGRYKGAKIFGLDISIEMLDSARKKVGSLYKLLKKADFDKELPFSDSSFDQIVSTLTLYALPRPEFFLKETHRVLKPGGCLTLTTPKHGYENGLILKEHCGDKGPDEFWLNAHESPEREKNLIHVAIKDSSLVARLESIANYNRHIKNSSTFYFPREQELIKLLRDNKFKIIDCRLTYAKQDYLITANKEMHDERI